MLLAARLSLCRHSSCCIAAQGKTNKLVFVSKYEDNEEIKLC